MLLRVVKWMIYQPNLSKWTKIYLLTSLPTICGEFCDELKHGDTIPGYRKNENCDETNYRPVSMLTNIAQIYEK